jgi:hypothetical protein
MASFHGRADHLWWVFCITSRFARRPSSLWPGPGGLSLHSINPTAELPRRAGKSGQGDQPGAMMPNAGRLPVQARISKQ